MSLGAKIDELREFALKEITEGRVEVTYDKENVLKVTVQQEVDRDQFNAIINILNDGLGLSDEKKHTGWSRQYCISGVTKAIATIRDITLEMIENLGRELGATISSASGEQFKDTPAGDWIARIRESKAAAKVVSL